MKYSMILADCPWLYADQKKKRKDGAGPTRGIGACHHYNQMPTAQLCDLDVQSVTAERSHLYLWATMPLLPDALRVMDAWGFKFSTVAFCWVKMNRKRWRDAVGAVLQTQMFGGNIAGDFLDALTFFGPGFYTGSNIELVLLGTRGQPFAHMPGHKASQVVYAPLSEHSAKPEEVQRRIEWMYLDATPRLEMFGRRARSGWTVIGNEAPEHMGEDVRDSLTRLANVPGIGSRRKEKEC